jgi:hypothetical protein
MIPVPQDSGVSTGYLKPADGIVNFATGTDTDRGGINWNGVLYRVMGTKLVSVASDGTITEIGDVGGTTQVTMVYSFDYLAIASNDNLFLYDGATLEQVTDENLGTVLDVIWVDGYFMTTDGEFLVITELNDPFQVDPLKYGSSEVDPDPIKALLKLRNEVYALNRYTIEVFDNIGASGFPFQRLEGAQIERGTLGTHTNAVFMETIAFLGSGREEAPAIWAGNNSTTQKLSTREIDLILLDYTEEQLSNVLMETRIDKGHELLYIHLPDKTLVFDGRSSSILGSPVWFTLSSSLKDSGIYHARNIIWCYDKWISGNPTTNELGYFVSDISTHYDNKVSWEFGTQIVYNEGRGGIFYELELVALTGNVRIGIDPTIWTEYSIDGLNWSMPKAISAGLRGQRIKRLVWFQQGNMENWRIQRFRGNSDSHISIARLEARIEPLYG